VQAHISWRLSATTRPIVLVFVKVNVCAHEPHSISHSSYVFSRVSQTTQQKRLPTNADQTLFQIVVAGQSSSLIGVGSRDSHENQRKAMLCVEFVRLVNSTISTMETTTSTIQTSVPLENIPANTTTSSGVAKRFYILIALAIATTLCDHSWDLQTPRLIMCDPCIWRT
jgi:hypothetical protein